MRTIGLVGGFLRLTANTLHRVADPLGAAVDRARGG